mmetsp:Transcript_3372/g.4568  ORF Transcript_3372/g.4568 Transcript_3372/m.4568 type:complete len:233 (-) Transcript_3372:128-826(-)
MDGRTTRPVITTKPVLTIDDVTRFDRWTVIDYGDPWVLFVGNAAIPACFMLTIWRQTRTLNAATRVSIVVSGDAFLGCNEPLGVVSKGKEELVVATYLLLEIFAPCSIKTILISAAQLVISWVPSVRYSSNVAYVHPTFAVKVGEVIPLLRRQLREHLTNSLEFFVRFFLLAKKCLYHDLLALLHLSETVQYITEAFVSTRLSLHGVFLACVATQYIFVKNDHMAINNHHYC